MIRLLFYMIIAVLAITILRMVIGAIMRGASVLLGTGPHPRRARNPEVPAGGELKRDPVCGTYVSTATSLRKTVGSEVVYFCSAECRDKYRT